MKSNWIKYVFIIFIVFILIFLKYLLSMCRYSSVRNDYGVQALAPTITLEFYLMTFDWNEK